MTSTYLQKMETLIREVKIYSQKIGMEFGIEKCAMQLIKSGKPHLADGMELPSQDKIRTLEEKETYKYFGILKVSTIKLREMKDQIKEEYLRRTRKLLETKLYSRYPIKGINTWAVSLVRYSDYYCSGPDKNLSKWTKEQGNYWPYTRHYIIETTLTDYVYLGRREEDDLPALKTVLTHRYNDSRTA